jgi:hypothetical protein
VRRKQPERRSQFTIRPLLWNSEDLLCVMRDFAVSKEKHMNTRFGFVALVSGIVLLSANYAAAAVGDVLDINKDGFITDSDAETVIEHLNMHGSTNAADAQAEFPFTSSGFENDSASLEDKLHNYVFYEFVYSLTSTDLEHLTYRVAWQRRDTSGDGWVSPIDALLIINWLNSH